MKALTLALVFTLTASLAHAGPILDSATRQAARVELEAVQAPTAAYRKGSARKWLEWLGIVGGTLMTLTVEERCFGRLCEREWSRSVGGVGLGLLAVSAISKALPDPE